MTTTFTTDTEFAYIDRVTKHGTTFAACGGIYNRILIAQRASGGGVNFLGASAELTAQPLDIVSNGTPSAYYVLTDFGITTLTAASSPVITREDVFDTGGHRWLFYSGGNLISPMARGGVRLQTVGGTVLAQLSGIVTECTAAAFAGGVLYVFDGKRGKMAMVTVTATALVYEGTVNAPNCRAVLRAVIDGTNLYCLNRNRVVRFSITAPLVPTVAQDYGQMAVEFTDIAVIGTGQIWFGLSTSTPGLTGPEFFGALYGVWDSTNAEIHTAAPKMSAWMVSNVIPVYGPTTIDEIVTTPPPTPVVPPAPVITSVLTASVTEDALFSYTITATGVGPITYGVTAPPSWLTSINALTGVISGTPPDPATINISITATNVGGTDTEVLVLTVAPSIAALSAVSVNGSILSMALSGSLLYVGGVFTTVTDSSGTVTRNRGACLNLQTGLWQAWNPNANSSVESIAVFGGYVYLGGIFTTLGGSAKVNFGRVGTTTATLDASWSPAANGAVYALLATATSLYVGGVFTTLFGSARTGNGSLDSSGALTSWRINDASTRYAGSVVAFALSGSSIVAVGGNTFQVATASASFYKFRGVGLFDPSTGQAQQMAHGYPLASSAVAAGSSSIFVGNSVTTDWSNLATNALLGITRNLAAAVDTSGTITAFNPNMPLMTDPVRDIVAMTDGGCVLVGAFTTLGGSATYRLVARVDSSGSPTAGFSVVFGSAALPVQCALAYGPGIVIGGDFTTTINGSTRTRIAVVNATTGALY